ncbi:MAG: hypothetical protein ABSG15_00260 [FCB group bacterium]
MITKPHHQSTISHSDYIIDDTCFHNIILDGIMLDLEVYCYYNIIPNGINEISEPKSKC